MTPPNPGAGVWERLTFYRGGTVAHLAAAPDRDGTLAIFAATPAGVFRSGDAGRSWRLAGGAGALPFVTTVAPSPAYAEDRTVFAGTLAGLFRSRDGGESWQPVLAGGAVLAVAVSPAYAEDRAVFVGTAEDGILRSEDGGDRWVSANAGLLDLTVPCLVLSERFRDDGSAFAGTASGLYRSRNGGKSWQEVDLGEDEVSVQAVSISPRLSGASWIALATEEHGVLLSDDDGRTWFDVPEMAGQSVAAIVTWAAPGGSLGIDAALDRSVFRSVDAGASWQPIGMATAPVLTLLSLGRAAGAAVEHEPDLLVGLVGDGVARLASTGLSPTDPRPVPSNDGLDATVLTLLAVSPNVASDGTLFAASADGTVLVSRDRGRSLARLVLPVEAASITGLALSPGFHVDRTLWISTADALLRSRDGGETWTGLPVDPPPGTPDEPPGTSGDAALPVVRLLAAAAENGRTVLFLAAGSTVGRSDDGGEGWDWLGTFGQGHEVVRFAARAGQGGGLLYAATTASGASGQPAIHSVWRSGDGGRRWEQWLDIEADGEAVLLAWDGPASEPNLLVAVGNTVYIPRTDARERRGGASRPLWRTVALGSSVSRISSLSTPAGPHAGRTIYAGTDAGVYVSRDGGRSFEPWSEGLDPSGILAVAAAPDEATHGEVFAIGAGGALWHRYDR